jgi:hypothetical protein
MQRFLVGCVGTGALVLLASASAAMDFGARTGYYTDAEAPFVGAELVLSLSESVRLNPNVEVVLRDGRKQHTVNLDAFYEFPSERRSYLWLGGGASLFTVEGHTDIFTNFFCGVGLARESVIPYFQLKLVAKDDAEIVVAFGLRF